MVRRAAPLNKPTVISSSCRHDTAGKSRMRTVALPAARHHSQRPAGLFLSLRFLPAYTENNIKMEDCGLTGSTARYLSTGLGTY